MRSGTRLLVPFVTALALSSAPATRGGPVPGTTSLTNPAVKFTVPARHHVVLKRGPITAIVVDNHAVEVPELPGHRAGYNGLASLTHARDGRNVFVPALAGINLVIMVNVAVVVETVFAWPGIGRLLYEGITFRDFPVVQGVVLMGGAMIVMVNLLIDILYAVIDPRIRLEK